MTSGFKNMIIAVIILPTLLSVSLYAQQQQPVRLNPDDLLLYRDEAGKVSKVQTPSDWQKRRKEIIHGMEKVMGPFPGEDQRVALDVKILEEVKLDKYTRQLITYQSSPGSRTPAYLCIPHSAKDGKKVPAVLCLHPTDNKVGHQVALGLGGREGRQYAAELAERGYVTIAPAYPHLANYWPNLGKLGFVSGTMKAIWDNSRAIDLLESLDYVDLSRGVGAIGHSLGGHNAIYTAVFDPRVSAIVSSCGFDSYRDYYNAAERVWYFGKGWCQIRYMPRMSDYRGKLDEIPFDFPELLGALAPRPVYVNAPLHDSNFRWKSVDQCAESAQPVYELLGAKDKLVIDHPDCDHNFPLEQRNRAYQLFDSVLKD
ncbi:Alpha/beta hydrolase family protein [Gimesia alba]|uniref:Alpha/beta hydrolase family protein n=1 Tax=Gimesia alba TaxID=2527973 RepID=A0A517RH56_9PLAN|nr:alpha/beta hydrolase [Gimesia alba]QDT43209.1 Alpha/beta hydrolase family protein [Gimesia alba]